MPRWLCCSLLSTLLLTGVVRPEAASAQPAPLAGDVAVAFAREGLEHYEKGAWAEAFDRFEKADAASHSPVFRLYMARAQRNLGKLLRAREIYRALVGERLAEDALASWRQAQADGRAELTALEPTIPALTVRAVGGWSAPRLEVDGAAAALGALVELDPGEHRAVVVDGEHRAEVVATLRSGERERVLDVARPAPPRSGSKGPVPPGPNAPSSEGSLVPGIVLTSIGGAALLAGAVFGGLALEQNAFVLDRCPDTKCPPDVDVGDVESAQADMRVFAHASTGLLIGGAVVAATGVVLLVLRPGGEEAPAVEAGLSGAKLSWSF